MKDIEFEKAFNYEINIIPSNNKGFYVKIGCAKLVFKNYGDLILALKEILENPKEAEKEYNSYQDLPVDRLVGYANTSQPITERSE